MRHYRRYLLLMTAVLGVLVLAHVGASHATLAASHVSPLTGTPYEP